MKRSEMIECMVNHWLGAFSGFEKLADDELKEDIRDDTYENMSKLLALLEYKGMMPPLNDSNAAYEQAAKEQLVGWEPEYEWEKE
jgi:hypothetical protein